MKLVHGSLFSGFDALALQLHGWAGKMPFTVR